METHSQSLQENHGYIHDYELTKLSVIITRCAWIYSQNRGDNRPGVRNVSELCQIYP